MSLVYFDRGSYTDNYDGEVSLVDAVYYATVTISTTGYGDITPVRAHARIVNAIVVTPLRVLFLVLLVGTTLEVLANQGRRIFLDSRWRKRMRNHVVVVGFGTKGRSAVDTLEVSGVNPAQVVVIDGRPSAITDATPRVRRDRGGRHSPGGPAPGGDHQGPRGDHHPDRDDSAILVMLTVRQLNPSAHVVVAVREEDNASLLRQSGANAVVTSSRRSVGCSGCPPSARTSAL